MKKMKTLVTSVLGLMMLVRVVAAEDKTFDIAVVDPFYKLGVLCTATALRLVAGLPWVMEDTDCAQYLVDSPDGTGLVFDDGVNDVGECGYYSIVMDSTGYVQIDKQGECFNDADGDSIYDVGDESPDDAQINNCENDADGNMDFSGHRYGRYAVCRADNNLTAADIHVGASRTVGAKAYYIAEGSVELKPPFRVFKGNIFSVEAGKVSYW